MKTQQTRKPILDALINASESLDSTTRPPEQHSPLPWKLVPANERDTASRTSIRTESDSKFPFVAEVFRGSLGAETEQAKDNAAYIVKACNEYPKLRQVLEEIHTWLICPDTSVSTITEIRNLVASVIAKCEASNPTK